MSWLLASAVLSLLPVNTGSVPEQTARFACPRDGINSMYTSLLSFLFQVGQEVPYKQGESPHVDPSPSFHCIKSYWRKTIKVA